MKIAIVTQPLSDNYGGILQNYALQTILKELGHKPITLNVVPQYLPTKIWLKLCIKWVLGHFISKFKIDYVSYYYRRDKVMDNFVKKHIKTTPIHHTYQKYDVKKMEIDAIIVGSDQVWRKLYNFGVWKDKFLLFASSINIAKIAYAASWGTDKCEFDSEEIEIARSLIKNFKAISVREDSGIKLCIDILNADAVEVLDPTLLLKREDYLKLTQKEPVPSYPYLAAYVLDKSKEKTDLIQHISEKYHLNIIDFGIGKNNLSIERWLSLLANASFVVTDSFHGTVFSIINHRQFATIFNSDRGKARFLSLLRKFNLTNRAIYNLDQFDNLKDIDWEKIDNILDLWRTKSIDFLKNNLK